MRVIGAAGKPGRHLWPLVNMGGGGGAQAFFDIQYSQKELLHQSQ